LLAATYRRKEGDFVTCCERGTPFCVFLIHGRGDGRAKIGEAGKAPRVTLVKVFDAGAVGYFGVFLGDASDVFELAEK
jgi:hypothetical protein